MPWINSLHIFIELLRFYLQHTITCMEVIIDGFWIDDRIYYTLWYSA
jgi:hypothetical protein